MTKIVNQRMNFQKVRNLIQWNKLKQQESTSNFTRKIRNFWIINSTSIWKRETKRIIILMKIAHKI